MKTITIPETRFEVLLEMLTAQPPRLLQDDQVKGFLLSPEQYEAGRHLPDLPSHPGG